jgi:16S rRNA (adenine1518-N6/adenine1519-N6)-dimethyltransferase
MKHGRKGAPGGHGQKGGGPRSAVRPKKELGQHFLKDPSIALRIAETLGLSETSNVLEIGPGTGVLTQFLLERPIRLIAVELDRESIAFLKSRFLPALPEASRGRMLDLVEGDFLKIPLDALFSGEPFAITGNFPYNISTQIVFRLLEHRHRIPEFSGMFQKEVAERICSGPGSKVYGILSVLVQAFYRATYCFTVPPDVFEPPPAVSSGVLHLARREDWHLPCDEKAFFHVVKTAFNQRRKTLRNSLKSLNLSENLKEDAIFDRRPEQVSVREFITLSKRISDDAL